MEADKGKVRLRVAEREQVKMVVSSLDDLLPEQHRARLVWEVVSSLDLSAFHASILAREGVCGRDATDPKILVALWLYASLRGVASARELERLCEDHRAYRWLCGGVSVNHHLLSDFRVAHGVALNDLFTRVIAVLVKEGLVKVKQISQDGLRVRSSAGSSSFRRESTLVKLEEEAREHLSHLQRVFDDPKGSGGLGMKKKAARLRGAKERLVRIEKAKARLGKLKERNEQSAKKLSAKQKRDQQKEPRASTSDEESMRMKMGDGGYRPASNVQIACDTRSRAIVGVDVSSDGTDYELSAPMREQVETRSGEKVEEHLFDGGYVKHERIEEAEGQGVRIYAPPKPARKKERRSEATDPSPSDSKAIAAWRARMKSEEGKKIYKLRAAVSECTNAMLRRSGLTQLTVRGNAKIKSVVLWCALAYNLMLFAEIFKSV